MGKSLIYNLEVLSEKGTAVLRFNKNRHSHETFGSFPCPEEGLIIKIYRKQAIDFKYEVDMYDYFESEDFDKAELIFEGKAERECENTYKYIDKNVTIGAFYTYWITTLYNDKPILPKSIKIVDPEIIWSQDKTNEKMKKIEERFGKHVKLNKYGYSTQGKPMYGLHAGNTNFTVVIVAGVHAAEAGQPTALSIFEKLVENDMELLEKCGIAVLPSANPDISDKKAYGYPAYLRTNSNQVDLNRNFDANWYRESIMYGMNTKDPRAITYRGPYPASEAETKAVIRFIESFNAIALFSLHCYPGGITCDQLLGPGFAQDDTAYTKSCESLAYYYSSGYQNTACPTTHLSFGTTSGSLPTWAYLKYGIPAFDVEPVVYYVDGPYKDENVVKALNDITTTAFMAEISEKHYQGIKCWMRSL